MTDIHYLMIDKLDWQTLYNDWHTLQNDCQTLVNDPKLVGITHITEYSCETTHYGINKQDNMLYAYYMEGTELSG